MISVHHNWFNSLIVTSYPRKQAALAGTALSMIGVSPLNNARGPSVRIYKYDSVSMYNTGRGGGLTRGERGRAY